MIRTLLRALLFVPGIAAAATGPYTATISLLQATDVSDPWNTVWLNFDVTNSPCANTNVLNRFAITSSAQHAVILAAVMANKTITIYGTGTCNAGGIESIQALQISP